MPLQYLHETTSDWNIPNHIYILDGTTCVGYIKKGTEVEKHFIKPLKNFDKRKRTFTQLKTRKQTNLVIDGWLK